MCYVGLFCLDLSVSYQSGPLKRIERCVAKAETDYSDAKYPTSAKILDIIRCACVYDNCDDLVAGMRRVANRIEKQDTELKKVCLLVCVFFCLFILARKNQNCVFVLCCFWIDIKSKEFVCHIFACTVILSCFIFFCVCVFVLCVLFVVF